MRLDLALVMERSFLAVGIIRPNGPNADSKRLKFVVVMLDTARNRGSSRYNQR